MLDNTGGFLGRVVPPQTTRTWFGERPEAAPRPPGGLLPLILLLLGLVLVAVTAVLLPPAPPDSSSPTIEQVGP